MTSKEAKSCIKTIEMLRRLAYNIHGVMDVIDAENCEKIIKALEQEPSGDLISREQALKECHKIVIDGDVYGVVQEETLLGLPSVNPQEPKTGHWIRMKAYEKWECSECSTVFRFTFKEHNYCPNCGARMESEDDNT